MLTYMLSVRLFKYPQEIVNSPVLQLRLVSRVLCSVSKLPKCTPEGSLRRNPV